MDPHLYWEYMVKKYTKGTSLHIWSPEEAHLVGSEYDDPFDKGITCQEFLSNKFNKRFDTIILHMIFGKCRYDNLNQRKVLFRAILTKAKELGKTIIITDHNKESGQFDNLTHLPSSSEILKLAKEVLGSDFDLLVRFSPGNGVPDRNIIINCFNPKNPGQNSFPVLTQEFKR